MEIGFAYTIAAAILRPSDGRFQLEQAFFSTELVGNKLEVAVKFTLCNPSSQTIVCMFRIHGVSSHTAGCYHIQRACACTASRAAICMLCLAMLYHVSANVNSIHADRRRPRHVRLQGGQNAISDCEIHGFTEYAAHIPRPSLNQAWRVAAHRPQRV